MRRRSAGAGKASAEIIVSAEDMDTGQMNDGDVEFDLPDGGMGGSNMDISERFSALLRDKFENGYRLSGAIDRNRMKQYYEDAYGEKILLDDDEISGAVARIGMLQDGKIYYRGGIQSDLLDDIWREIDGTFLGGASCIYISRIFERHAPALAEELFIYDEDVLRERLDASCGDSYLVGNRYIYMRGRRPDADDDVRKAMASSQYPLNYAQLGEILWYIPIDIIKHSLVNIEGIVNVARETYYYAENLPVSAEELTRISDMLKERLTQRSFVTGDELRAMIRDKCPSVAVDTEEFTTWGLRNVLAYLLRDRFSMYGTLICEKGKVLTVSLAFEEFCDAHDRTTLDELKAFAAELDSNIIWESVFSRMIRISRTEFVRRGMVNFDAAAIDGALEELVEGDYVSIKDFKLYLHLPSISPVNWNQYVLEGYAAKESRKFTLLHASYSQDGCCGAIVRRSSNIKDFKSLLTDVLANDHGWSNQREALGLLVNRGYLQQRKYSKIDAIISDARRAP